jgi:hypothetical protein
VLLRKLIRKTRKIISFIKLISLKNSSKLTINSKNRPTIIKEKIYKITKVIIKRKLRSIKVIYKEEKG